MAIVNAAQVEMVYEMNGQIVENVFHCVLAEPLTEPVAQEIKSVVQTWQANILRPKQSPSAISRVLRIRGVNEGELAYEFAGDGLAGTYFQGTPVPNHVTLALKKNTMFSGRKYRGRFYFIGLTQQMLTADDKNLLVPGAVTELVGVFQTLVTELAAAGYPMGVLQRDHTVNPPVPAGIVTVVSITVTDTVIDSQRRRLPRRGR